MRLRSTTRARLLPAATAACLLLAGCAGNGAADLEQAEPPSVAVDSVAVDSVAAEDNPTSNHDPDPVGIHLTGEWEVTVRHPDGALASTTTFHNDLTQGGNLTLAALIGDPGTRLNWVRIGVRPGTPLCDAAPHPNCQFDTTTQRDDAAAVLSSSIEAVSDGAVDSVVTWTDRVSSAGGTALHTLTERDLDAPISFVSGQTVEITVTLTFS